MTHLLTGSDQEFEKAAQHWATNNQTDQPPYHKNAFGQSALHLAVIFPKRLRKLLELGMRPKVLDLGDTTPLMYAAAYGQLDSIIALLGHKCYIHAYDTRNGRCFIDYALVRRNLNLITDLVQWLREQAASELALDLLGRCVRVTFAQCSLWSNSGTLDWLFRLCGDSDIALGSTTSMHLARDVEDARVVLRNNFTAVEVVDDEGETALMRVSRFLDTRLLYKMLDIEATAGVFIDRQDFSGWSVLMHVTNCMDERNSHLPEETVQLRRASAVGCLNMLLLRGASPTLTDSCNCPCSPDGCSALSITLHRAVESIGVFDSATSISRIPLDFAIALQTCTDNRSPWATDTIKTFVNFLETGELHTCCARRRVRSALWPPPSDCSGSQNARKHTRLATSAENPSRGGMLFQLARLYDVLRRRSQAQHDEALVKEAKRNLNNRRKQRSSGLVIDTVRDHYTHVTVVDIPVPPVLRMDIEAYRDWTAWCVAQPRKLYSRRSLAAWARESSTFVDRLEEELVSLA
jgi:ankyrin repeat protein